MPRRNHYNVQKRGLLCWVESSGTQCKDSNPYYSQFIYRKCFHSSFSQSKHLCRWNASATSSGPKSIFESCHTLSSALAKHLRIIWPTSGRDISFHHLNYTRASTHFVKATKLAKIRLDFDISILSPYHGDYHSLHRKFIVFRFPAHSSKSSPIFREDSDGIPARWKCILNNFHSDHLTELPRWVESKQNSRLSK